MSGTAADSGAKAKGWQSLAVPLLLPTWAVIGLFLLVVNAGMLALVGWIVPGLMISGFWSALFGAIVVSIVSTVLNSALAD